ncbi:MAG: hypothetical protein AAGO57_02335 [Pseudomonadota bacterium]
MADQPLDPVETPSLGATLARMALRFVVVATAAFALVYAMDWATSKAEGVADDIATGMMIGTIALFLLVYALLIAVPFVPGIEIGIALLVMRGDTVAPFVYLATVAGLALAYGAGQTLSYRWLHRLFADLRMKRACRLIDKTAALSRQERLDELQRMLPGPLRTIALQGRYIMLAILLNVPGNALIGGGGGISMLAGLSRVFAPRWTLLTIALAVLPVPLAVWIWGGSMLAIG